MKITIFGLTLSSSWGNGHATPYRALLRALSRRGHKITFYEKDVPYYAARRDLVRPDFCELILYSSWDEVSEAALRQAAESDVVMTASYCPEGARINDEVLSLAAPMKVFYDLDAPVTLSRFAEGASVEYIRPEQLSAFDLVLSWTGGRALKSLVEDWHARIARPLFGCVDPDVYRRVPQRGDFACEMSYMGTYAADRQQKVDDLFLEPARRLQDRQFLLAGSLYPWHWQWPENVRRFDHVAPCDHPALYSSSRCTLNITRAEMEASGYCPSGRFFEAAACATPIITDWFDGLDFFFAPGQELIVAAGADDVLHALALPDEKLRRMAGRARERTLDEHTGDRRAEDLLRYLDEALTVRATETWDSQTADAWRDAA